MLIRTVSVTVTVSGWPTFSIPISGAFDSAYHAQNNCGSRINTRELTDVLDSRKTWLAAQNLIGDAVYAPNANH